MSTKIITEIVESLKENFDENALQIIERTLYKALKDKEIIDVVKTQPQSNEEALVSFLAAKKIEGCSSRSIAFYQTTLQKMFAHITKIYYSVTTEDIRLYLSNYQDTNKVSKSTIDNNTTVNITTFLIQKSPRYSQLPLLCCGCYSSSAPIASGYLLSVFP